ncbi:caskin-2 isoform X3 [Neocloeon triangulifer]|uniref:caskin-2 isoform X3 n=1 Tax=Neocloeon triangulifer TaxID=2078957 RepID=UPI00286F662C|nr:caskin-2 isoform X3 [Neocloeon triangulifer]
MMACFGPLLLPPRPPPARNTNNASAPNNAGNNNRLARRRSSSTCRPPLPPALPTLSSTYLSFDDEVEFEEIIPRSPPVSFYDPAPPRSFSLLHRSHSEGNLRNLGTGLPVQRTFNKCIRALSGSWKNLLQGLNKPIEQPKGSPLPPRSPPNLNLNNLLNSPSATVGGMSRPPNKQPAQVKKVAPPSVPEVYRHSGSSFGSAGYSSSEDGCFLPPPDPSLREEPHSGPGDPAFAGIQGKSPGAQFNYPAFTFPGPQQFTQLSAHTAAKASFFHQQEDQGIDMTQSPGRDSPGSSGSGSSSGGCRHSTASLDSGRASGYLPCPTNATRSSMLDSPRCSLSSSSIGSDHATAAARVERLLKQGVPDQDAMHAWLMDLHFEEYFPLFANAGYDMAMVARMTPVDLTAIGIKKPNHRKKLKSEIAQLNIPDGLPDFIPGSLEEWLRILRLEEYGHGLAQQGYKTVEQAAQLAWEDLEDTGIVKLGHQKKILLAIKRVKDIQAGKRPLPGYPHQDVLITTMGTDYSQHECLTSSSFHTFHRMAPSLQQFQQLQLLPPGGTPGPNWGDRILQGEHMGNFNMQRHQFVTTAQICSYPEFVPIKIRGARGKSLESLEGQEEQPSYTTFGATEVQIHPRPMVLAPGPGPACWRPRSYDDGDITPTNEVAMAALHEGGGTLPRPRGMAKPRPVAKVMATRPQPNDQFCKQEIKSIPPPLSYKSLPRELTEREKYFVQFDASCQRLPPPSPPKRFPRPGDGMDHPVMTSEQNGITAARQQLEALTLASNRQQPPHQGWDMHETELIGSLAMQQNRNGSDASFKSSSSTESDSLPFANENAGTIKQRANRPMPPNPEFSSPKRVQKSQSVQEPSPLSYSRPDEGQEPADVLNDIGNMLANLTDELDAMLEEEKRQGLGGQ